MQNWNELELRWMRDILMFYRTVKPGECFPTLIVKIISQQSQDPELGSKCEEWQQMNLIIIISHGADSRVASTDTKETLLMNGKCFKILLSHVLSSQFGFDPNWPENLTRNRQVESGSRYNNGWDEKDCWYLHTDIPLCQWVSTPPPLLSSALGVCIQSSDLGRKHVVKEEEEGKTNFKKIKRAELSSR